MLHESSENQFVQGKKKKIEELSFKQLVKLQNNK